MPTAPLTVEAQFGIGATPEEVFKVLADPATWSTFDDALVDVVPMERLVLGASGTMRRRVGMGLTVTTRWENTALVPATLLDNVIKGFGYELRETIALSADAAGSQVAVVDTLVPTSIIGRAMVAMSRGIIERDLHARFAKLKSLLETSPTNGA
jgi:hypothetical protein